MKILLLDPQDAIAGRLRDISRGLKDVSILTKEEVGSSPSDSLRINAIVAGGDFVDRTNLIERLLMWRTHPHTYLVPCWIVTESVSFGEICLWPRLAIDRFEKSLEERSFSDWLTKVAEWQQNRMQLPPSDSLVRHSVLELITSLALRRASGKLLVFDEEGNDGKLVFHDGCLTGAMVRHLNGEDAFFEFFSWAQGSYLWEPRDKHQPEAQNGRQPLTLLINQGLRLLREANLLYHFLPDLDQPITKTHSESALDDGGVPFFNGMKEIYMLINGKISALQIVQASPLSRPRTMGCLAKWFSLGDIRIATKEVLPGPAGESPVTDESPETAGSPAIGEAPAMDESPAATASAVVAEPLVADEAPVADEPPADRHRLLIVDDSHLICRALQSIFSNDRRFEIVGVAHDGLEALSLIEQQKPDVVTLDIQMPRMDGLTALKHIMIRNPTPVVVLSSLTKGTSHLTYESFKYGAVSVFTKPSRVAGGVEQMEKEVKQLLDTVWQAANVQMEPVQYIRRTRKKKPEEEKIPDRSGRASSLQADRPVVVILCGTGGFPSLLKLLVSVSKTNTLPFIFTCMAMPRLVVEALVPNLDKDCNMTIDELVPGKPLHPGVCYLYSYDDCFHLFEGENQVKLERSAGCPEHLYPFDHLLSGVAESCGNRVIAILISGEGQDGFKGMRMVHEKGGQILVLSPEACLSPELPRRILEQGYAQKINTTAQLVSLLESGRVAVFGKSAVAGNPPRK